MHRTGSVVTILSTVLALSAFPAMAERDVDDLEELLPHRETLRERLLWEGNRDALPPARAADPPPAAPVRNCAEWEPCTGVLIRYPLGLPYELLREFDDDVTLHVVVRSSSQGAAISNMTANGVDMGRVEFLVKSNDSIWTRDYGPWFVFDGNGDIAIVDHTYNRPWRPNDNAVNGHFGTQQGIPVVSHDMFHAGGNYMTDGAHIGMSTDLVYNEAASENGMSSAQVDQLMLDYYGITDYEVVSDISGSGIHHIDTWAKFLDEETVLVKEVWSSHSTYAALEQRATLLASLASSTGRNYAVHRVYCHNIGWNDPAAYTNSLILNDQIYVPAFGNASRDSAAVDAYRAAAPGYDVRAHYYSGFITDDALHCRAKGVMDRGMLRVEHIPVRETTAAPVLISAVVDDRSGAGIAAVELHYRYAGDIWRSDPMTAVGGDSYEAFLGVGTGLPLAADTTLVEYYIHATDLTGRSAGMPRVEPAHWYTFPMVGGSPVGVESMGTESALAPRVAPNPVRGSTTFSFELRTADEVQLSVYDITGRRVATLVEGVRPAGENRIHWDTRDDQGRSVASGVYFFRLRTAGIRYSRPVQVVR
ncbi:MAG: agmatine deiminase family protein [Gemmatimonadota bacterium]|jgi:agmatine/peptidylarginine deiminase|nr:agmatine deiminase family protein [Gemmatimonadota bacterium]MDP6801764.1 agmatine deiminase family protein [Gemmatimonadota bacterium]MDP7031160.1 agmatine deiminase family protein [Gemmatimonadota bacterium]